MKNSKFFKITLAILTVALCLGAAFAMSVSADDTSPTPVISQMNIEYSDRFSLMYAVPASTVTEGASVTLYIHDAEPTEDIYASGVSYTVTADEIAPAGDPAEIEGAVGLSYDAYVFTTAGIGASSFTDNFWAVAQDNTTGNFSEVLRYSVAEYLYQRLSTDGITSAQKALYDGAIAFGAGAQQAFCSMTADDPYLISNLRYVTIEGGNIGGYTKGVYPMGVALSLTPDDGSLGAKWSVTPYTMTEATDDDGNVTYALTKGEALLNQTSVTLDSSAKTEIVFGSSVVINYTDGYRDLENIAAGSNVGKSAHNTTGFLKGSNVTDDIFKYYDDIRGIVIHPEYLSTSSGYVTISTGLTEKTYANVTNATAFEYSMDIKLDAVASANNFIQLRIRGGEAGTANRFYLNLYQYDSDGEARTTLYMRDNKNSANTATIESVNPSTDWFHVRIMIYSDDPNTAYVYINGDTESCMKVGASTSDNVFSALKDSRIFAGTDDNNSVYADNIFIGFTTATNPNATTSTESTETEDSGS